MKPQSSANRERGNAVLIGQNLELALRPALAWPIQPPLPIAIRAWSLVRPNVGLRFKNEVTR